MQNELEYDKEDAVTAEQIYDGDKLDFENIKNNPVLKPIADINKSFVNFELLIRRAMWEYGQAKEAIDGMIELNATYSETIIMSKIQLMLIHIKQIIHSQNIQKENMKDTINEMVRIVQKDYELLEKDVRENQIMIEKKPETKMKEEEKPKTFYSELIGRDIPLPENKLKTT